MSDTPKRRDLLGFLLGLGFLTTLIGFLTPVAAYLMPLKGRSLSGNTLEDANGNPIPPDSLKEGQGMVGRLAGRPTLVVKQNGQLYGFSAVCTHLGCVVRWNEIEGHIECPCHGGHFNLYGHVTAGPPPKPLSSLPLTIHDNKIIRG